MAFARVINRGDLRGITPFKKRRGKKKKISSAVPKDAGTCDVGHQAMESSVTDPNLGFGLAFQLGAGLAFTHLWEWVMHMRAVPSFLPPVLFPAYLRVGQPRMERGMGEG